MIVDEKELRKSLNLLKPNGQLVEIRLIPQKKSSKTPTYVGYFDDAELLIQSLKDFGNDTYNVYFSLNEINTACKNREQYRKFLPNESTTSDNDIVGYDFLMVDLDPVRPQGISSSQEELDKAIVMAGKIYSFMEQVGFNKPIKAYSGNGVHLLYKVNLSKSQERVELMKTCLSVLSMLFSDELIKIDVVNFNPSRICKLYGTVARKGRHTEERPHRMAKLIGEYETDVLPTDIEYLNKLAGMIPKQEKPHKYNNYSPREFDVEEWMSKKGLRYRKSTYSDGDKYILDCCPFNSDHKGKDAVILRGRNNQLGFHCFHNGCFGKGWKDVRLLFEPDAYEEKQRKYEERIYSHHNRDKKKESKPIVVEENKPLFYTAMDVFNLPVVEEEFIKTGITDIDKRLRGLKKGYVSVVSGMRASSKSTILNQITLSAVDSGNNVGLFSGELTAKNLMRWMYLQAAGKGYVEPTQYEGYYNVLRDNQKKIAEWMNDRFWLYNNDYGNDFEAICNEFEKCIEEHGLDLLILDNLMAFNISSLSENKWDAQTEFVLRLQKIAKSKNVHISFVAHPRKAMGFLRLDDISGTGDLANAVDNAFIVHRVNNDFKRLSKMTFGWSDEEPIYNATNCIEIAKDRDGGVCDYFVPLYYEMETKRLKNNLSENVIYGWNKDEHGFSQIDLNADVPF